MSWYVRTWYWHRHTYVGFLSLNKYLFPIALVNTAEVKQIVNQFSDTSMRFILYVSVYEADLITFREMKHVFGYWRMFGVYFLKQEAKLNPLQCNECKSLSITNWRFGRAQTREKCAIFHSKQNWYTHFSFGGVNSYFSRVSFYFSSFYLFLSVDDTTHFS